MKEKAQNSDGQKQDTDQKPTLLRGHHLPHFQEIVQGNPPEVLANTIYTHNKEKKAPIPKMVRDILDKRYVQDDDDYYAYDLMGHTEEEEVKFERDSLEAWKTLADLPDDAEVALVDTKKDIICGACIHGNHCEKRGVDDRYYMNAFTSVANNLGLQDDLVQTEAERDNYGYVVREGDITTTAGVVREVLADEFALKKAFQKQMVQHNFRLLSNLSKLQKKS